MEMPKKPNNKDALAELLAAAPHKVLSKLIIELTVMFPDVRRECFDFLKSQSTVSKALAKRSKGEAILALWSELAPDMEELDMYGGGDYGTMDHVADLLDQIRERLESKEVDADHRRELLDLVLPFIQSGNAGMNDMLDDVAYAACYDDGDLRGLAQIFEAMEKEYKVGQARHIYRRIGDRDKYLELRKARMVYGSDYHDLATFYWESGEKEKALQVAEEGLRKAQGGMNELRGFVAARAQETGDRDKYMVLRFEQATDDLTFEKYKTFRKMCTSAEWTSFEAKVLISLKHAWKNERLKIRMHRREYDEALAILIKGRYPMSTWDGDYEIKVAKKLEKRYPEEILKYYLSGLGNLNRNAQRKEYTRKAKVMVKVRHMLVDVLDDEARWEKFARKVKQDNHRRPAFQQEFADAVPGWSELN
jgi:hypothetical protein